MPHWKALRYGKDGSRGLSCCSTFSICQGVLKSENLLHKRGFVKTQSLRTVTGALRDVIFNKRQINLAIMTIIYTFYLQTPTSYYYSISLFTFS